MGDILADTHSALLSIVGWGLAILLVVGAIVAFVSRIIGMLNLDYWLRWLSKRAFALLLFARPNDDVEREGVANAVATLAGYPKVMPTLVSVPRAKLDAFLVAYVPAVENGFSKEARTVLAVALRADGVDVVTGYLTATGSVTAAAEAYSQGVPIEYASAVSRNEW